MAFDFSYEWRQGPPDVCTDSHRSTWADLSLGVDNLVFTENTPLSSDDDEGGVRMYISVSVFPLAEFIAANWWPLLHEPAEKERLLEDAASFKRRHWIDKHTDGFAYPTVGFFGAGSFVRIEARPTHIESANIQFPVTSTKLGIQWEGVKREEIEAALLGFLADTVERLPVNHDKYWLQDVLSRILHSRGDAEEAEYCRCAGLLGADPYDPNDEPHSAISQTIDMLGQDIAIEMFATSEAADVVGKARWLQEQAGALIKRSRHAAAHASGIKDEFRSQGFTASTKERPWERGYAAARQVRKLLRLAPDAPMQSIEALSKKLLDDSTGLVTYLTDMEAQCGARGAAFENSDGLGIALAPQHQDLKFQLAATFADFLLSGERSLFLSTRASTDRQKCNRAFAAEFLAPIDGIRENWLASKSPDANWNDIAKNFGVSRRVIQYQIQNQAGYLLEG